jgi:hypothetical protein
MPIREATAHDVSFITQQDETAKPKAIVVLIYADEIEGCPVCAAICRNPLLDAYGRMPYTLLVPREDQDVTGSSSYKQIGAHGGSAKAGAEAAD